MRLRISGESSTIKTRTSGLIGCAAALAHEAVLQRICREICIPRAFHLLEDACAISADRLHRQMDLVGNLGYRFATRELHENLKLPIGEVPMRWLRSVSGNLERQRLGKRPADVLATR